MRREAVTRTARLSLPRRTGSVEFPRLRGGVHGRAARGLRVRPGARQRRSRRTAYRRGDLFDRRRVLMADTATYVA